MGQMKKAKIVSVLAGILILGLFLFLRSGKKEYSRQSLYFDTVISVSFFAGSNGEELMDHCMDMCAEFQNIFSRTDENSELYGVNHRNSDRVKVSHEIRELVEKGLEYYDLSGGKFDITIAPLSDLWDFKSEDAGVPDEKDIYAALEKVGADRVHIDGEELVFDRTDTMIDLGALVKGYAADRMKEYLVSQGVTSGLINLGGNVLTIGSKPDGTKWKIGIQKPFASHDQTADVVSVEDRTVVSSGIYERYFEQDGRIYHHILDPDTGYPVENDIEGISVICDSSLEGDAMSTTCLLLGISGTEAFLNAREGVEGILITRESEIIYAGEHNE